MELTMEWNIICRICLQEGEMHSIFDTDDSDMSIADKIMLCSNLKIAQGQNLPEQICSDCLSELNVACYFRNKCESSNAVLGAFTKGDFARDLVVCSVKGQVYKYEPPEGLNIKRIRKSKTPPPAEYNTEEDASVSFIVEAENDSITSDGYEESVGDQQYNTIQYEISEVDEVLFAAPPKAKGPTTGSRKNASSKKSGNKQPRTKEEKALCICELCGNSFKYKHSLETHMRRHRNEKPFSCEICKRSFVLNVELNCHMRTHTGQKPYACRYCSRRFSDFGSRIKHERSHTGERPYVCDTCGKTFAYSYGLSSHVLTHTGEKPHECEKCGKHFTKKHHLTNHLKTHLKQEMKIRAQQMLTQGGQSENDEHLLNVIKVEGDQYVEEVTMIVDEEHPLELTDCDEKPVIVFDPDD